MKKDKIILISFIFLVLSALFFSNSINFQLNESAVKIKENELLEYPRGAGQWNLVNLTINGTAVGPDAHNWSWAESQPWFGGGIGSEVNPYRIENITIANTDRCIEIFNSEKHFILQNCKLYNSSQSIWGMGIYLFNVSNGIIQNNNMSQLNFGIATQLCSNITIQNNNMSQLNYGIAGQICSNITIYGNYLMEIGIGIALSGYNRTTIDRNEITAFQEYLGDGIAISSGSQIQIISNEISKFDTAIFIESVLACNISSNRIYDNNNGITEINSWGGTEINIFNNDIFLIYENAINIDAYRPSCIIDNNHIYMINGSGILVGKDWTHTETQLCLIQYNRIELCNKSGIRLVNANNISIKSNTLVVNYDGISIEGSTHNNLFSNIIENNTNYGILLDKYYNENVLPPPPDYTYSVSNNVSLNTIRSNKNAGICCNTSGGNVITQNTIDNNSKGVYLSSASVLNQISNNVITNHNESGILLIDRCDYNTISENRINYNYCGVKITLNSDNNELIGNDMLHNVICYTIAEDCDDTSLVDNVCSTEAPDDFFWLIVLISALSVAIVSIGIWYYKRRK